MTFEEWFEKYNYQREYTVEEYVTARTAWNAGMNALVKAHQIRPRGKSILVSLPEGYVLVPVEPTEALHSDTSEWERGYDDGWSDAKARYAPDGYVLVPVEPTEKIFKAGVDAHDECGDTDCHCSITDMYEAMIQAAQEEE